jgi:beta-lactamase superfamily II metal-dependent hydrolase
MRRAIRWAGLVALVAAAALAALLVWRAWRGGGEYDGPLAAYPVRGAADLRALGAPVAGEYRVHLIDVGSGLSILVQGADFALLYDGGTSDDFAGDEAHPGKSPLVAYLRTALGPSGPPGCRPPGEPAGAAGASITIDHLVLSHPHMDHANLLDEVLACYDVDHVWDAGAVNHADFYRDFWRAVAAEPGVAVHTAGAPPLGQLRFINGTLVHVPRRVPWTSFAAGHRQPLGAGAAFTVLHTDPGRRTGFNQSSVVLRVELGGAALLLMGDAESGARGSPRSAPGGVESRLLKEQRRAIDADVLQVGHHGSATSSRVAFLRAVSPRIALISAGPRRFGEVTLPDVAVVDALESVGARVYRTDENDAGACPAGEGIGGGAQGPGGCDGNVVIIGP